MADLVPRVLALVLAVSIGGGAAVLIYPSPLFVLPILAGSVLAAWVGTRIPPAPAAQRRGRKAPAPPPHTPDADHAALAAVLDADDRPMLLIAGGRVQRSNRPARALLGNHIDGIDMRAAIRHPAAIDHIAGSGATGAVDLIGMGRPDQRWQMQIVPLPDGARLVVLTDVSARRAVERMRSDFVANASHELRTPLAAILGYVETLQDPDAGDDPGVRTRFLSIIEREARRMQALVDDLISISRIESTKGDSGPGTVDLAALVRRVVDELLGSGQPRAADIILHLPDTGVSTAGEAAQLSQMFHNVIANAMKYGAPATPIDVTLDALGGDLARIRVQDRGDGIAADHLPRVTERFYRVDAARSRSQGGTGLGLAIVKHVVERHRGRLDIASTPGEGTVVTIMLPLVAAPVPAPSANLS